MKSIEEFITSMVKIEKLEKENGNFGYYPFAMYSESPGEKDGKLFSIANTVSIKNTDGTYKIYKLFANEVFAGANKIYLALDFPAGGDMEKDFVMVISFENGKFFMEAIPYDLQTGEQFERVKASEVMRTIALDVKNVLIKEKSKINQ